MKLFVLFALCAVAAAAPATELNYDDGLPLDYHESFGIAEAARIRQYEQGLDFDGSRIAGGDPVGPGAHPHLGGLVVQLVDGRTSVCGCSLLTNTRAVTAAHCWRSSALQARLFTVVYASRFLFRGGVRIDTTSVDLHVHWNVFTFANDVAIITHRHVAFNNEIRPINLPSGAQLNNQFVGTWAQAAGYGRTGDNVGIGPDQDKRQVQLQVISNAECRNRLGIRVIPTNICTSGAGGRSTCPGDSGGPLAIGSGNNRVLIGITSFGTEFCTRGEPAAYVRVTSFAAWIRARI